MADEIVTPEDGYDKAIEKKEFRKRMSKLGYVVGAGDEEHDE